MYSGPNRLLALNGGSPSVKFAVYEFAVEPRCVLSGQLERIGQPRPRLSLLNELDCFHLVLNELERVPSSATGVRASSSCCRTS